MTKILIIEDEKQMADFISLELNHEGYEVDICYDGEQGYEKAIESNYDVILLDVMLPKIRRKSQTEGGNKIIQVADLKLDLEKKQVSRNNKNIELTKKEYDLLEYLMKNNGIVVREFGYVIQE